MFFGLGLLAITNCASFQTPTVLIAPSITLEASATVAPTPIMSSQTPTIQVIPSATIATIAIIPTLDADQAYVFLQNLMKENSDCQLPCWTNIKPGTTSNTDAETLLQPLSTLILGGISYKYKDKEFSPPIAGGRDFFFDDVKIRFNFGWASEQTKNTVELLMISADALNNNLEWAYSAGSYSHLFESYNLHNILSQYGMPTQVWTIAEVYYFGNDTPNSNLSEEFNLLIFYDKGILIHYRMPLKRLAGARGKACPSEAFFDMMLVPPGTSQFYQGMMFSSITDSPSSSPYMPIEKSTQMTFDEFYQSFKNSNSPCFEIPLTIWPQH